MPNHKTGAPKSGSMDDKNRDSSKKGMGGTLKSDPQKASEAGRKGGEHSRGEK